jgi:ribulose-5-phosphate 4-epimerase/fuculose-1-phosphate aldolase
MRNLVAELADANHVLVDRGVLDAYGHISARHPGEPSKFLISRNLAPALVEPDDIQIVDLDGRAGDDRPSYLERFLHAEIYRARPEVEAVVHSHAGSLVPFSVVDRPLIPIWHMAAFLGTAVPTFEIRDHAGPSSDLLIRDPALGVALAATLGDAAVALMRGHGAVIVGSSVAQAVHRAVYAELNARALSAALALGDVVPLSEGETAAAAAANNGQIDRAWKIWRAESRASHARGR